MSGPSLPPPSPTAGTDSPTLTVSSPSMGNCPCTPLPDVGAVPQSMIEQELDDVIAELGQAMVKAFRDGDKTGARLYLLRMEAARASRTPEHRAKLEAEALARVDELTFHGRWVDEIAGRRRMGSRAA